MKKCLCFSSVYLQYLHSMSKFLDRFRYAIKLEKMPVYKLFIVVELSISVTFSFTKTWGFNLMQLSFQYLL